jgi:hypothetical protein
MILSIMLVALGFLIAMLIALLLAPAFWRRAERLTARRLEQSMPMSIAEAEAERDQIRASYAIIIRRLEAALSQEKMRSARQLVKISRLQMEIADLNDKTQQLRGQLDAEHNAASVLRRTIATRVPELNRAAQDAKQVIHVRDREIDTIVNRLRHREEALAIAQRTTEMQQAEIGRLRQAMEMSGAQNAGRFKRRPSEWTIHDYRAEYDRLNVELSKLRERLAVAYDREANQVKELRTELQQLADQIVTTASSLPEGEPHRALSHAEGRAGDSGAQGAHSDDVDTAMRSIDAIIADVSGGARTPAATDGAVQVMQEDRPARGALARAARTPARLARGAMQKVALFASVKSRSGAGRSALASNAPGAGRAMSSPMPGEVSAAKLLGGAAAAQTAPQSRSEEPPAAGGTNAAAPEAARPAGETAATGARAPSTGQADAAAPPESPAQADADAAAGPAAASGPEKAPAPGDAGKTVGTPSPAAATAEDTGGKAEDDNASLYDRYRSAKPTSGKLMDDSGPAGYAAADPSQAESATDEAGPAPEAAAHDDAADKTARDDAKPSANGAAAPDPAKTTDTDDEDGASGSLLDRLKQVPESETR